MVGKRYYWLKLKEDYFNSPKIKKLRKIAGGDTYTIIYLKMQLLSIKNEGIIQFEQIEPTFEEEIALKIDEDIDNVAITLAFISFGISWSLPSGKISRKQRKKSHIFKNTQRYRMIVIGNTNDVACVTITSSGSFATKNSA